MFLSNFSPMLRLGGRNQSLSAHLLAKGFLSGLKKGVFLLSFFDFLILFFFVAKRTVANGHSSLTSVSTLEQSVVVQLTKMNI